MIILSVPDETIPQLDKSYVLWKIKTTPKYLLFY